ncbi:sugar ABC transporter substrate-binding protein [Streptomyces silvisoli]|uniref:Substrate-binding domain-containing protein n=1 Tax=Streptomyces silvisoli TaxID=3034235 RepID=A0ABT5ZEL0_9ACTN|nr:substrate-binding domain-containing protein [Streptomyces silvisoli]MDF3288009.1 substrate-binding domain-containing protein [Streptomyces silvisoli]
MKSSLGRAAVAVTAVSLAVGLAACGTARGPGIPTAVAKGSGGFTIGLLLPDTHTARWATADKPLVEKKVRQLCPHCTVDYANASADVATQQQQIDSMIANGVRVLILDPVDYKALRSSVTRAHDAHIPVVSYDRLAQGPVSAYSSYDSWQIGRVQAQGLLTAMGSKAHDPRVVMMNGDPTDPNTAALKDGALSVLKGRAKIAATYYTGGWIPENAFSNMSAAIAELGAGRIDGVLSANDGLASGALSALKAADVTPLPPITGQDADLGAIQRLLTGEQSLTVYKSFVSEADAAARMAVALGRGRTLHGIANARVSNDTSKDIPAVLGTLVPVTVHTIRQTVVDRGPYTVSQICTPQYGSACQKAGLTG